MTPLDMLHFGMMCSLCTTALHVCIQWPGMILHPLLPYLERHAPLWLHKPLFDCLVCMSSIWTIVLWLLWGYGLSLLLILQILVVAGINTFASLIISYLNNNNHGQPM